MRLQNPSARAVVGLALLLAAPEAVAQARQPAKAPRQAAVQAKAPAPARVTRRDPFRPLLAQTERGAEVPLNCGPGKAGLVVGTLRVDGVVRSPSGMISVVTTPQQRVYFLREGERLCNGAVERITMEAVTFRESGKDPFGKAVDRPVTKRIYPSAGEQ
jgi:Tfp pilus assembly protein PilP